MIIYKITNLVKGKIYIGQTSTELKQRISSYYSEQKSNRKSKQRIISAFRKYGFENFIFDIIDTTNDKDDLNAKEIYWIQIFKSTNPNIGYNVLSGGKNVWLNDNIRERIITGQRNKIISEETKKKISNTLKGHGFSKETLKKMSDKKLGHIPWNKGLKYNKLKI